MGVPGLFKWVIIPYFESIMKTKLPTNIDWAALDLNAIFHTIAGEVYNYGEFRKNLERHRKFHEITERDAALAKKTDAQLEAELFRGIGQFIQTMADQINPSKGLLLAVDGLAPVAKLNQQRGRRLKAAIARQATTVPGELRFDGASQFTPGTELMRRLSTYLRNFIVTNRARLPPKVVYSSHLARGEGEHKLMKYIRRDIPTTQSVVMVGADADLIMLGLRVKHPFYIVRNNLTEEYRYNRTTQRQEQVKKVVDIGDFRQRLGTANVGVEEFVMAMFLFGNDFLPAQPGFDNIEAGFPVIWEQLKTRRFFQQGNLDVAAWHGFLQAIAPQQRALVETVAKRELKYPFVLAQAALNQSGQLDANRFRDLWYQRTFFATLISYTPEQFAQAITDLATAYFTSIAWVWRYYTDHQSVSWKWAYPRLFTPLLVDIQATSDVLNVGPQPYQLNPIGQLFTVLPRLSRGLVPAEAQAVYEENSPIADMYPKSVVTILEGRGELEAFLGFPYLPPIDIERVIAVQGRLPITKGRMDEYAEETDFVSERPAHTVSAPAPVRLPTMPEPNRPLQVAKVDTGFTSDANIKALTALYGYDVVRMMFPPTRRFYTDILNLPVATAEFPIVPAKVREPAK